MIVREFNENGITQFEAFLKDLRQNPRTGVPWNLLQDVSLTQVVTPNVQLEQRLFSTRADAAQYLSDKLKPIPEREVVDNRGLWTWLSLFFFDSVCPVGNSGRKVRSTEFYIYYPKNPHRAYYHLLCVPWRIVRMAPRYCRLFLCGPVHQQSEVTQVVMKRLYLLRIPCIFEVLDRLYWDEPRGRPRRGIVTRGKVTPGDLRHRLPIRIRQLEKTYDLVSLSADQLIELLGDEFRQFDSIVA